MQVRFAESVDDALYRVAVIAARSAGKWVFCRHRDRQTLEMPGGHREAGEPIDETARRELFEETGALAYRIEPVCAYWAGEGGAGAWGMLYFAEITALGELPGFEMEELFFLDAPPGAPERWTYPQIQPLLLQELRARGYE